MFVAPRNLTWTLILLSGVCSQWDVEYRQQHICAVKGSSVVIPCSFKYPSDEKVNGVMWSHDSDMYNGPFIYDSTGTNNHSRLEYFGNMQHNCSFKIHHLEPNDAGKYFFRFVSNTQQKWSGKGGSTIKVVDLNVSVKMLNVDGTIHEGDSVNLTCTSGCDGKHLSSTFSWFKNGEPIDEGPVLYLSNMSSTNSGSYTCSLKSHMATTSEVINIDVEYSPKNTSVTVGPSMEVFAGSNFTLVCSSHSNPPVAKYAWFKLDENGDIKDVGHESVLLSGDGGEYFCQATNKHGSQNSSAVTLKVKKYWATIKGDILVILTVTVTLIVTIVIVVRRFNKKKKRAPEDTQDTEYVNWPVFDNNQSEERSQSEEAADVIYTTVDIHSKRKLKMEPQMSQDDHDHVIYSKVCR